MCIPRILKSQPFNPSVWSIENFNISARIILKALLPTLCVTYIANYFKAVCVPITTLIPYSKDHLIHQICITSTAPIHHWHFEAAQNAGLLHQPPGSSRIARFIRIPRAPGMQGQLIGLAPRKQNNAFLTCLPRLFSGKCSGFSHG